MTTSENEWYDERQRMTTSDSEWQGVPTNNNEWQRMTESGTTNENNTVHFNEWMTAILSLKKKIDILLQGTNGFN